MARERHDGAAQRSQARLHCTALRGPELEVEEAQGPPLRRAEGGRRRAEGGGRRAAHLVLVANECGGSLGPCR